MVEHYDDPFDVCLALHACGNATDFALLQAQQRRAAYVVSPCCVGMIMHTIFIAIAAGFVHVIVQLQFSCIVMMALVLLSTA